jgi:hypothetical protein
MAVTIEKLNRYLEKLADGRQKYRILWRAVNSAFVEGDPRRYPVYNCASFPAEPSKALEAEKFAAILAWVQADIASAAETVQFDGQKAGYLAAQGFETEAALLKHLVTNAVDLKAVEAVPIKEVG